MGASKEFPGWTEADDGTGTLTLSVTIAGDQILLATVVCFDKDAGLWETYIGQDMADENMLGRFDSSRARSVRKAEAYLISRLRGLT